MKQNAKTPGIWNPLPYFDTVRADHQEGNIQDLSRFYRATKDGTLPAVSWVAPSGSVSEHLPALVSAGQAYVTGLINAIMKSPAGPRLRSSCPGTTGAASTTASARRRRTRTVTACGCRAS